MSLSRARSLSIDALYRPIPQGPETVPLDQEQTEEDDIESSQPRITPSTDSLVDSKIKWIHFILGCSVLLPWNGAFAVSSHRLPLADSDLRS